MPVVINGSTGISGVDGSAGTPAFQGSDTNTGIRFGTDIVSLVTGGSDRLYIDSSGRLGVGTTSPAQRLQVGDFSGSNVITIGAGTTSSSAIYFSDGNSGTEAYRGYIEYYHNSDALLIGGAGLERARIDSSGRLLVGTSSARANFFNTTISANLQIEGTSTGPTTSDRNVAIISSASLANSGGVLILAHQKSGTIGGNTAVASGDNLGYLSFQGSDGTDFVEGAAIAAEVDGTPGANDMPGRLVFLTTADGAASTTEAMRINNQRELLIGTTTRTANGGVLQISNGITFPATQSACSNANTLDDYEEGTWTPIATPGTGSGQTTSVRGEYTKIGNQVTLWGEVIVTGVGTAASFMQITGLPFNVVANDRAVGVTRDRGTQNNPMGSVYSPQNDRLILVKYDGTTPWTATTYWMFSVSYQV